MHFPPICRTMWRRGSKGVAVDIRPPDKVMAWLGPVILLNIAFWLLIVMPESSGTLCAQSQNCLTDWLSATSGWAAVVAAFVTVRYLQKQINDANTFNSRSIKIQLRKTAAIARRATRQAKDLETVASTFVSIWQREGNKLNGRSLPQYLDRFAAEASNPVFDLFEDEIGTEHPTTLKKLRMQIEATRRDHEQLVYVQQVPPLALIMALAEPIQGYAKMIQNAATAFLEEEKDMTSIDE